MSIDPSAPAFPATEYFSDSSPNGFYPGIPIRLEIAARLMAGYAANSDFTGLSFKERASEALSGADALIAAYNKSQL